MDSTGIDNRHATVLHDFPGIPRQARQTDRGCRDPWQTTWTQGRELDPPTTCHHSIRCRHRNAIANQLAADDVQGVVRRSHREEEDVDFNRIVVLLPGRRVSLSIIVMLFVLMLTALRRLSNTFTGQGLYFLQQQGLKVTMATNISLGCLSLSALAFLLAGYVMERVGRRVLFVYFQ